jgi:hypothetical protein
MSNLNQTFYYKTLVTILLILLLFSAPAIIYAQGGDSQPPQINFGSINVIPSSVNVGESVTFSATVTDNMSGVKIVQINYVSPSGNAVKTIWKQYDAVQLSVNVSETIVIDANTENGTWLIEAIFLHDHAGNMNSISRDIISNPSQYDFTVNNPGGGDSVAPTMDFNTINITPGAVNVGESVTFAATVTDNLSGVKIVQVNYKSPSGDAVKTFWKQYDSAQLSVNFSDTIAIGANTEGGTWLLEIIFLQDHAGIVNAISREDIASPSQYDFTVNNPGGGDSVAPTMDFNTINITPGTVNVGESVTFAATVTDNLSGVKNIQVTYKSPSGNSTKTFWKEYSPTQLNVNFTESILIDSNTESGAWQIELIALIDHADNIRIIERANITNPSQYDFTVINTYGPEEGNVNPENGSATVNFPNSNVTITVQTDEAGTITVYRYPTSPYSPPDGLNSAGIFLNITPSANLQGKPATIVISYSLPLPDGVEESALKLYRWSGSEWTLLPNQTLNTTAKTITVQVDGFSTFGVFGSGSSDPSSSFKKIVNRYLNILNYSGQIEHEHTFSFGGGLAGMIATGKGDLGGVHAGTEVESLQRRSVTSTEFYNLKTHADALPGNYLRVVSGTSNHTNHSSQLGVEAKPGEIAVINEDISTVSNRSGSGFKYTGYLYSSDGRNRMEVGSYGASVSFDVTGTSEVFVSITNQDGSTNAGWWSIE